VLLLAGLIIPFATVQADIDPEPSMREHINTGGDANSVRVCSDNVLAETFTSNNTIVHTITSIKLHLKRVGSPGVVKVAIKAVDTATSLPTGADLSYGLLNGNDFSTSYGYWEFFMTPVKAFPLNTQYAITVKASSSEETNYIMWHNDSGGDGSATTLGSHSIDGTVTWVADAADYLFEVWGKDALIVKNAKVFDHYLVAGDMLVTAEIINIYPDYAYTTDPTRYFQLQMLRTDNITIIGATPLKDWGDRPISLYLSPALATPLTHSEPYLVRVMGTFTGNPSANYTLKAEDWNGANQNYLDSWIITTADSMNEYDGNTATLPYTTKISGVGRVLTGDGGAIFTNGIAYIENVRPDMFAYVKTQPTFTKGVANPVFDTAFTWQTMVGTKIAADATTFGTLVGVDGQTFLALLFIILIIFALVFVFFNSQGAETPQVLLLCIPILLYANYLRVIPIQVTTVLGAILALLFVRAMWWTRV